MIDKAQRERIGAILDGWFGAPGDPQRFLPRPVWFATDPAFDAELRRNFAEDMRNAAAGAYDGWAGEAEPCLALILLLDQLPRNLARGSAAAFASDGLARAAAAEAQRRHFDRGLPAVWRWFLYLPFEHSEALEDQVLSVALFAALPREAVHDEVLDYARRHHDIIARFGRFPHRNAALGRVSTAAELDFLKQPYSSF